MNISKLTITPLIRNGKCYVTHSPSVETAQMLIKERLVSGNRNNCVPRAMRKIPDFLKGLVNPETKVINNRKFDSIM